MAGDHSILSIDFGTSNTIAMLGRDGTAEPLLFDGSPVLSSAVFATADGRLLTGTDARRAAASEPARFEPNPKRRIDDGAIFLGDAEYPIVDLIGAVLARIGAEARRVTGGGISRVVMTHPAAWGPRRRELLRRAAAYADLPAAPVLVPEPVAAAYRFSRGDDRIPTRHTALVYDLGAGTCDLTVVAHDDDGYAVVDTDGIDDLGGLDIDHAIIEHLRRENPDPDAWERLAYPRTTGDRRQRRLLWDDVREVKELLSRETGGALYLSPLDRDTHFTRPELESLALPLIMRSIPIARRLAERTDGPLSTVYLTGGSSRMPLVATELLRALRVPPVLIEQPELVIAAGALYAVDAHPDAFEPEPAAGRARHSADPGRESAPDIETQRRTAVALVTQARRERFPEGLRGFDRYQVDEFLGAATERLEAYTSPFPDGDPPRFAIELYGYRIEAVDEFLRRLRYTAPDLVVEPTPVPETSPMESPTADAPTEQAIPAAEPVPEPPLGTDRAPAAPEPVRGSPKEQVGALLEQSRRALRELEEHHRRLRSRQIIADDIRMVTFRAVRIGTRYEMSNVDEMLDHAERRMRDGKPPWVNAYSRRLRPVTWLREGYNATEVNAFVRTLQGTDPRRSPTGRD